MTQEYLNYSLLVFIFGSMITPLIQRLEDLNTEVKT
jgi:hypothetical protein